MTPILIALAASATICQYDPSGGKPNPLGMRSYVSVVSTKPNQTHFMYDAFGNAAHAGAKQRELVVALPIAKARAMMRSNAKAFAALTGDEYSAGDDTYARIDAVLKCSAATSADLKRVNDPARVRVTFTSKADLK